MLPKGRRKYKFVSFDFEIMSESNLSYQILGILLIILGNSISSINGITIKYNNNSNNKNNNDVQIPLDSSTSASSSSSSLSSSQTITSSSSLLLQNSGDASMDGFDDGKHLITSLPNFDDNNYNEYKEYYDRLTTNNPCLTHYCPKGRECILNNNTNKPNCICQRHCTKRKRPICGSNGQIYRNHCRLHQASCLLNIPITYQRLEKCQNKNKHKSYNKQVHYKSSSSLSSSSSSSLKPGHLKKYQKDFSMNELSSSSLKQQQQYHDNNNTDDDLINNNNNNSNDSSSSSSSSTNTDTNDDNNDNDKHRTIVIYKESILGQNNDKPVNNHINNIFDEIITIPAKKLTKDHTKTKFSLYYSNEKENILHQNNINNNNKINNNKINNNNLFDMNLMNENHYINDNIDFIDTTLLDRRKICTSQEYEIMKDNLLLFNHARLMSQNNNHSKDFLVSIMFSHYDQNNDAYLEIEELNQISIDEHLEELSNGCILEDMLTFDDLDNDEKLSINEFYQAFSKLYSVSVVSLDKALETNHLSARVGDNVEIKCDVTGSPSPPIIWQRNDIDLSTLNYDDIRVFSDGSLYLTRIQLLHSGNYTCHAQRNKDVVQTHILSVYTIPQVLVMPRIQSKRPGENAEMWCHVTGDPLPKVEWLKNDEKLNLNIPNKYEIIGNGTALQLHNIQYSDTGAYMCQATNIGGTVRDISSLVVQEEPTPTVLNEERKFFVFHENGISIYEPSACRLYHQIQSSDIIPGTQEYICGKESTKCSWGRTVTAGPHYIYATQPELDRVLVISTIQMVVVDVVQTDKYPVELFYVQKLDQIWILNWQYKNNIGKKIVQVICEAGQKRKHYTIHPELIDGQIDLIKNLFIPSPDLEQPHFSYNYGYITHENQRNIYKLDLANLRYIKSVDLTLYDCVPDNIEFSALYGFVILSCQEPTTDRPRGQLILDYLTDAVLITKPSLYGIPKISPDSRNLVTIQHHPNETVIVVQKITSNGLEFMFDVKTTLNVSDVTFYESQTTHGYDLFASANDKENILYLNLCTGKVEMITGVGLPISKSLIKWENPARMIRSSGLFGLYMLTTANSALFVINGRARSINCKIGGVKHPTAIVWTHALPNYMTNRNTIVNEL